MNTLTAEELAYLSAWAKEEQELDCWSRPAHRLQAEHRVPGIAFIRLIKAWAQAAGKKDSEIYSFGEGSPTQWPWGKREDLDARLHELTQLA